MANLNTKTLAAGVGDILAIDGGIDASTARQILDGDGTGSPFYITTTKVGVGDTTPSNLFGISSTTTPQFRITHTNDTDYATFSVDGDGQLDITTVDGGGAGGHICLVPDGNVGIGTASPDVNLEIVDISDHTQCMATTYSATDSHRSEFSMRKSAGTTDGTPSATADDESIGQITFQGTSDESTDAFKTAAYILCQQDAAATTTMSGRLTFGLNNADTTSYISMNKSGYLGIGVVDASNQLHIKAGSGSCTMTLDSATSGDSSAIYFKEATALKWTLIMDGSNDNFVVLDAGGDDGVYMPQNGGAGGGTASTWYDASDERIKTSITPIESAVDKLNTLQAVNFKWKYGSDERKANNHLGLLAQEVEKVFPEAVDIPKGDFKLIDHPKIEGEKKAENTWGIGYSRIVPVLVKAVQELSAKVTALENA